MVSKNIKNRIETAKAKLKNTTIDGQVVDATQVGRKYISTSMFYEQNQHLSRVDLANGELVKGVIQFKPVEANAFFIDPAIRYREFPFPGLNYLIEYYKVMQEKGVENDNS